jgi:NADH-quinone oxidoreductase subunit L
MPIALDPNDYALIALILGMPLLGAFVNGIWGHRLGKRAVSLMALLAVGVSFLLSVAAFVALAHLTAESGDAQVKLGWTAWQWLRTSTAQGAIVLIDARFSIDALSGMMMLVITGVGFLIHWYATSYMAEDASYARFFAYLNLFVFSMLVLVLADNLPVLFVGWEGVGLCSYLLIGFWYEKAPNAAAGKKAFIANRVGDFGLLCAMLMLVHYTGALDWNGIANAAANLVRPGEPFRVHLWPPGGGQYPAVLHFLQPDRPFTISAATAIGLALLLGCTGKSAQIPLYVWLPDAMAGPTPVSALIHAATMVTAGVYLICRLSFVFVLSPFTMMIIAVIGAGTALFAATIATTQNDIKKVLAYSTISQLGFMFLGVGVGAFTAGFFHVFTHAFFKACLFLGAGSVIHAMHARIHDDDKAQDIRYMGGLRKWLPLTHWTFAVATAAIIGFPLTSGFFSKDEILFRAYANHLKEVGLYEPPPWLSPVLFWVAIAAATLTAFYMCRLYFLTFWGDFRGWTVGRPSQAAAEELASRGAEHGSQRDDLSRPGYAPHESSRHMTIPLILLAAFSLFAGVVNPGFHLVAEPPMEHWLRPVFAGAVTDSIVVRSDAGRIEIVSAAFGFLAFAFGSIAAWWTYVAKRGDPADRVARAVPGLYGLVRDKWRIDELYDATVVAQVDSLAETASVVDSVLVDGIVSRLPSLIVAVAGSALRIVQNGVVHTYAALMVVGLVAMGWFFAVPHPNAAVTAIDGADVTVTAAPGIGYSYRWDADGDGRPDAPQFSPESMVKLHGSPGQIMNVNLEVKNAFGFVAARAVHFTVPNAPPPSP